MKKTFTWNMVLLLLVSTAALQAQVYSAKSNSVMVDFKPSPEVQTDIAENLGLSTVPKYHALIIGVSEYDYAGAEMPNLYKPVVDADYLSTILTTKYVFEPENTTVLKNPTREDIINAFDKLSLEVSNRDNLLIFYAGHGFYDKRSDFGFWLPSNAKTTSRADWIANSTIKDYIKAVPSKHTLLITDACFGGSIFKTRSVSAMDARTFYDLYKDKSRRAITSGNLTEVPDESYFIKFFFKVLEDNDHDFLAASAVFARLYEPVLNNSATVPQFGVIQGSGDEGGDFIFIKR